ncbi:unnamed protein product [Symbiodinium sp. CCMP2592]|nr:unnamed protein product [Symbiodinium sp. CCMP2592]
MARLRGARLFLVVSLLLLLGLCTAAPKKETPCACNEDAQSDDADAQYRAALHAVFAFMKQYGTSADHWQSEYDVASRRVENLLSSLSGADTERMNRDLVILMSGTDPAAQREMILRLQLQTVVTECGGWACRAIREPGN